MSTDVQLYVVKTTMDKPQGKGRKSATQIEELDYRVLARSVIEAAGIVTETLNVFHNETIESVHRASHVTGLHSARFKIVPV